MNLLKKMTLGLLAAVAVPSMASAQTVIHITGSTAFRAPITCAIISQLGTIGTASNSPRALYYGNSAFLKGTSSILANGTIGSGGTATIVVEANWTGSLAGVVDLATQNPLAFPDETNATNIAALNASGALITGNLGAIGGGAQVSSFPTITVAPDIAMTDAFASSCATALSTATITGSISGGATTGSALAAQINAAKLGEAGTSALINSPGSNAGYLGIVPFQWVLGNMSAFTGTVPTNISQQTASLLIANGAVPLSMFSSNGTDSASADTTDFAYLIGRNEDSGTRIDGFAEPQLGFLQNPTQWFPTFSGGSNTSTIPVPSDYTQIGGTTALVTSLSPWTSGSTLNTESNITWNQLGHGGYASGGDTSSVTSTPVSSAVLGTSTGISEQTGHAYLVSYLGISDSGAYSSTGTPGATGGSSKGLNVLSYNGVYASTNSILNGAYSFWSYEHMYYLKSGTGSIGSKKTFADQVANALAATYVSYGSSGSSSTTAPSGISLAGNNVARIVEGGQLGLNY